MNRRMVLGAWASVSLFLGCKHEAGTGAASHAAHAKATLPSSADRCASAPAPVCPGSAPEGGGLLAVDRCAFPMQEKAATSPALLAAIEAIAPRVSIEDLVADGDRSATSTSAIPGNPRGPSFAFRWAAEDDNSTRWTPQGITGSPDATATGVIGAKRIVAVSWYDKPPPDSYGKGVRIAFVDTTEPAPTYRFAMLAVPTGSAAAPNFSPLKVHAGGIAWYGDFIYVADTSKGFRVFDTKHIVRVATDIDEFGCSAGTCRAGADKYAMLQVGAYVTESACAQIFSSISVDRASSPPALVSSEYCSDHACTGPLAGRIYRWPLDPATGRLGAGRSWPSEAYLMGQRQVQGGASKENVYYLSSSAPPGAAGALYRVTTETSATSAWIDSPEDLMLDAKNDLLYSLSEGRGKRIVFAALLEAP